MWSKIRYGNGMNPSESQKEWGMKVLAKVALITVVLITMMMLGGAAHAAETYRVEVRPFLFTRSAFMWRGEKVTTSEWNIHFTAKLRQHLAAAGLKDGETHCVLRGGVVVYDVTTNAPTQGACMEIAYTVNHLATQRIKAKGAVSLDAAVFAAETSRQFVEQTTEAAADIVLADIASRLMPPEVIGVEKDGVLCVKTSGSGYTLKAGEFLTAFARGETVDWIEEAVGTVQIVSVTSDGCRAQIVEGDAKRLTAGVRLRRVQYK